MSPNKKLKLDPGEMDDRTAALILPEIELEIGIRKRLAQTIEDRIAWAELLRESLLKGISLLIFLSLPYCFQAEAATTATKAPSKMPH